MSGESVLMIHGAGGGAWEWNVWRRVFEARGWAVDAIDLVPAAIGMAETTFDDYLRQTTSSMATRRERGDGPAWIARAVAPAHPALATPEHPCPSHGARYDDAPNSVVLIGASLGGLLAYAAAAARANAAALVLINPLPPAPLHARLLRREPYPLIIPWRRDASLAGTRASMPDADDAACLYAMRRWRDESGAVLNAALAGIAVPTPACRILVMASECDGDVPPEVNVEFAQACGADAMRLEGTSHVGPLLGRKAADFALAAEAWCRTNVPKVRAAVRCVRLSCGSRPLGVHPTQ